MDKNEILSIIEKLNKNISALEKQVSNLQSVIRQYQKEKKNFMNHLPVCTSCGKNFFLKDLRIATQLDVDEYDSDHEGYAGPTIGELYCGC
jgi:predicted Zn-ribbon and HTH transcriptional regulator